MYCESVEQVEELIGELEPNNRIHNYHYYPLTYAFIYFVPDRHDHLNHHHATLLIECERLYDTDMTFHRSCAFFLLRRR